MADFNCKRMAAMDDSTTSVSKRRKLEASSPLNQQLFSHSPPLPPTPTLSCSSFCSDHSPPSSSCSSNEQNDAVVLRSSPLLDLEAKSFETVITSSSSAINKFSRETTPSSELCLVSDEMESPAPAVSLRRRPPVIKSPPSEEIEEFFAMAEKYEQKRFSEKYNFDIVKDVPLEGGRYQWIRLKP